MKSLVLLFLFTISTLSFTFTTNGQLSHLSSKVYIPNAFSPNDDGINDIFKVETGDVILENFQLKVFNRWGTVLFETDNYLSGWNGRFHNERLAPDVFVYYVQYQDKDGLVYKLTGTLNLLY